MSKVELNTVAVMFYSGNYNGHEPPYDIEGLKQGDIAQDNSTGVLWEYIGNQWFRKASTSGCKIFLGNGLNIAEAIANENTVIPSFIELYPGNSDNVPREFNLTQDDLVIKHSLGNPPLMYANYLGDDCLWHNVQPSSGMIVTDNTCVWTIWLRFVETFLPHSAIIGLIDIGFQNIAGYETSSESSESSNDD